MSKKAFTLTELLAVIVLVGLISVIIIPIIDNTLRENKEQLYQTQIKYIEKGLRNWSSNNLFTLPNPNEFITLTLGQLKQLGYVDKNIKNPKTNKYFPNDMLLTITNNDGNLVYKVLENTGNPNNNNILDENAPILIVNGSLFETIELNSVYTDKGVIALTSDEIPIDSSQVVVSHKSEDINTNALNGQYSIVYEVTDNGITTRAIRTLVIKDTKEPTITVPNYAIYLDIEDVNAFDIMSGVSVIDNSGEILNIEVSSNLSALIGNYIITYKATDSSGNTAIVKRVITVGGQTPYRIELVGGNEQNVLNINLFTDSGYKVYDKDNVEIIDKYNVVVTNPFSSMTLPYDIGIYYITYSVKNKEGLELLNAQRKVNVNAPIYDFAYTGAVETFTAFTSGIYKLEVWGAQGGTPSGTLYSYKGVGGYGGYSVGTYSLSKDQVLYVAVGGQGAGSATSSNCLNRGGWNGGGAGSCSKYNNNNITTGGGGSTDISTQNPGTILNTYHPYRENTNGRIIIAGGGGGAQTYSSYGSTNSGMAGGYTSTGSYVATQSSTTNGNNGACGTGTFNSLTYGTTYTANYTNIGGLWAGYSFVYSGDISGSCNMSLNLGGSGGGYYGGGGMSADYSSYMTAGGSSYIGGVNSNATYNVTREMYCYNCTVSTTETIKTTSTTNSSETPISNYAKLGNGHARITYLGP